MYVKTNMEVSSHNYCCCGTAKSITYFVCVSVALVTQHAKHMRHVILSSVASLAVLYFFTLSQNGTIFGGGGGSY